MAPTSPIKRVTRSRVKVAEPELKKAKATTTKKPIKPTKAPAVKKTDPIDEDAEDETASEKPKASKVTRATKASTTKSTKPTKIIITPASQLLTTSTAATKKRKAAAIETDQEAEHDELAVEVAPKAKAPRKVASASSRSSRSTKSKSQEPASEAQLDTENPAQKIPSSTTRARKTAGADTSALKPKTAAARVAKKPAKSTTVTAKKASISVAVDPEPAVSEIQPKKSTAVKKKVTFSDELGQENLPPPVVTKARRGTRATAAAKADEVSEPAKTRAAARRPVKRTKIAHGEEAVSDEQVKQPLSPKKITQVAKALPSEDVMSTPRKVSLQIAMRAPTPARPMSLQDLDVEESPERLVAQEDEVAGPALVSPVRPAVDLNVSQSPRRPIHSPPATAARQPPKRFKPINLMSTGMAVSPTKGPSSDSPLKAPPRKFAVLPVDFGVSKSAATPLRAPITSTPARRPTAPAAVADELDFTATTSITTPSVRPLGLFGRSKTPGAGGNPSTASSMAFQFRSVRPVSRSFQMSPSKLAKSSPLKAISETPFKSRASGGLADLLSIDASLMVDSPSRIRRSASPKDDVPVMGDAPPDPFSPSTLDPLETPRMSLAGPASIPVEGTELTDHTEQTPVFVQTADLLKDDSMMLDQAAEEQEHDETPAPAEIPTLPGDEDEIMHLSLLEMSREASHLEVPQTLENVMGTSFAEMLRSQDNSMTSDAQDEGQASSMQVDLVQSIVMPTMSTASTPSKVTAADMSSTHSTPKGDVFTLNEPMSVRKLSYENEQAAREALDLGEEDLIESVIGKRTSSISNLEPPIMSSPIGKMTGVQVAEDVVDSGIMQTDCQSNRKLSYENKAAAEEACQLAENEDDTIEEERQSEAETAAEVTDPVSQELPQTEQTSGEIGIDGELQVEAENDVTVHEEHDARSAISEDLGEAEEAQGSAEEIPIFEDATTIQDDDATITAPPSTTQRSESSAFDNNENAIPSIEEPQLPKTPEKPIQRSLQVFHTTAKIPLRPEGMISPMKNHKRRASTAGLSPRKMGPKSPFGRRDLVARDRQEKMRAASQQSGSSQKTSSEGEAGAQPEAQQTPARTPSKQTPADAGSPALPWSTFVTPMAERTPRRAANSKLLQGAVVFLDIRTSEGEEASACYQQLLTEMGARCVKQWSWNPDHQGEQGEDAAKRRRTEGANANIGITHVVFKDGSVRTMEKVRAAAGIVQCVTVRWVLDCEQEQLWMPELPYSVNASHIPRGGHRRRKSMEPRALSVIDGNLVSNTQNTPLASAAVHKPMSSTTRKVSSPLEDRLISFESCSDRRKSRNWTPKAISEKENRELVAEHDGTPVRSVADATFSEAAPTPMSGVIMHGEMLDRGEGEEERGGPMSPQTPYFLHPERLEQKTCPPKQQGAGAGVLGEEGVEGGVRRKLWGANDARRVTMDWKPSTASPLRRAF